MKKLCYSFLLMLLLCGVSSCRNDFDPEEEGNYRVDNSKKKPMIKTIRMSFGGDYITEEDEPLLRSDDGNTFVGINVFYTQKDMPGANEQKYAYGLFSTTDGITIDLSTGYTYRFEATILIEKDDKLWDYNRSMYGEPFTTTNGNTGFLKKDMDKFFYTFDASAEKFNFTQLSVGTAYVDAGDALPSRYGDVRYPRVKRYYGMVNEFDPSTVKNVEINMNYKTFGLKLNLVSIPGETSVTVADITDNGWYRNPNENPEYYLRFPKNLSLNSSSEDSKTWEGIFSLNDLKENTHEFKLRFIWNKGQGQTESIDHVFTAEAKKKKVLNIRLEGNINETKSGNIIFTNLDDTLTEDTPEEVSNRKK